jgi:hypothetical protein
VTIPGRTEEKAKALKRQLRRLPIRERVGRCGCGHHACHVAIVDKVPDVVEWHPPRRPRPAIPDVRLLVLIQRLSENDPWEVSEISGRAGAVGGRSSVGSAATLSGSACGYRRRCGGSSTTAALSRHRSESGRLRSCSQVPSRCRRTHRWAAASYLGWQITPEVHHSGHLFSEQSSELEH